MRHTTFWSRLCFFESSVSSFSFLLNWHLDRRILARTDWPIPALFQGQLVYWVSPGEAETDRRSLQMCVPRIHHVLMLRWIDKSIHISILTSHCPASSISIFDKTTSSNSLAIPITLSSSSLSLEDWPHIHRVHAMRIEYRHLLD